MVLWSSKTSCCWGPSFSDKQIVNFIKKSWRWKRNNLQYSSSKTSRHMKRTFKKLSKNTMRFSGKWRSKPANWLISLISSTHSPWLKWWNRKACCSSLDSARLRCARRSTANWTKPKSQKMWLWKRWSLSCRRKSRRSRRLSSWSLPCWIIRLKRRWKGSNSAKCLTGSKKNTGLMEMSYSWLSKNTILTKTREWKNWSSKACNNSKRSKSWSKKRRVLDRLCLRKWFREVKH